MSASVVGASRLLGSKRGTRRLDTVAPVLIVTLEGEKYLMDEANLADVVVVAGVRCFGDNRDDGDGET